MADSQIEPINKGGLGTSETRGPDELIQIEWQIINKLLNLAQSAAYEKHRTFYYQTLASHIRTLSALLKTHCKQDQSADLARLLQEIQKKAKRLAKRL